MISDPTARADEIASRVRRWYEANRESWWARNMPGAWLGGKLPPECADDFMLGLIHEVYRCTEEVNK